MRSTAARSTPTGKLQLTPNIGMVALVAANLYVIFFNFSWGPVMWVMLGEMFPNQIRGSALAVAGFAQWFANYLIAQSFPIMAAWSLAGPTSSTRVGGDQLLPGAEAHSRNPRQGAGTDGRLTDLGADFLPRPNVFGASY